MNPEDEQKVKDILGPDWGIRESHNMFFIHWWGGGEKTADQYKDAWEKLVKQDIWLHMPYWVCYKLSPQEQRLEIDALYQRLGEALRKLKE